MQSPISIYEQRIREFTTEQSRLKKRLHLLSVLRLVVFVAGIIAALIFFKVNMLMSVFLLLIFVIAFLLLVKRYEKLNRKSQLLEELIRINQEEIEALKMNFTDFPGGEEFTDEDHDYTYDLDIFGKGSIFQFINRTCTLLGKKSLAGWFSNLAIDSEEIGYRQAAVAELRDKLDLRQQFRAVGSLFTESLHDREIVIEWLAKPNAFIAYKRFLKPLTILIPLSSVVLITLAFMKIISISFILSYLGITIFLAWPIKKRIEKHHVNLWDKQKLLTKYVDLIEIIEQETFSTERLNNLRKILSKEKTSRQVKRLSVITNALDNRHNIVTVIINFLTLRDLGNVLQLEEWKNQYGHHVEQWFQAVAVMDALSSLGGFAFNYPNYIFPKCAGHKILNAKGVGHPLIHHEKRVNNDFDIDHLGSLVIITGANMAGKSTFLRTLGINMMLAMTGSVVCAQKFDFAPIHIFTGMRTKDSLLKDESYFRAELNRLKLMIDKLQSGEKLFVLLDELLKGTNSQDQHLGSVALVEKLINHKACGCLATHDLQLSNLEKQYPAKITNNAFEVELDHDELIFDYKLKEGVSRNMNASFLLRKMGIV